MTRGLPGFPGATAVSRLRVYDWPTADGLTGGSPHLHTASAEAYVVLTGSGSVQTLSGDGYAVHHLAPGDLVWFTPGTVHRLVNTSGDLEILVVMQNAGLPETGDAVLTFPPPVLADPDAYAAAAALPSPPAGDDAIATAARARRDLAIEGYLSLVERVSAEGPSALVELYAGAARLVCDRTASWATSVRDGAGAQAAAAAAHLAALAGGDGAHLAASTVQRRDAEPRYGMCGRLQVWS